MSKVIKQPADVVHDMGGIMDMIGGIKGMDNRPGEREPGQGKSTPAQKRAAKGDSRVQNAATAAADPAPIAHDARLGHKVDTSA